MLYWLLVCEVVLHLSNCAKEPEIRDLCNCLVKMGAVINGIGTDDLKLLPRGIMGRNMKFYQIELKLGPI